MPDNIPTGPGSHKEARGSSFRDRLRIKQGEVSNLSFWISHFFMLLATVLGVYLAGQQGLKQAVAFDRIHSDMNNYYLRKSLQDELSENMILVAAYAEGLQGISIHAARRADLHLDTFVWESMKFSSATLETPTPLLSASRRFYREVNDIHAKVQSGYHDPVYGRRLLLELVEQMDTEVMPMFDEDTEALRKALARKKVRV